MKNEPYQKTVDAFGKLKSIDDMKKAYAEIGERLAQEIEQEIVRKKGQLTDLEQFKETIKK